MGTEECETKTIWNVVIFQMKCFIVNKFDVKLKLLISGKNVSRKYPKKIQ